MNRTRIVILLATLAGCQDFASPLATEELLWAPHEFPAAAALPASLAGSSVPLAAGSASAPTGASSRAMRLGEALDMALAENLDLALARAEQSVAEARVQSSQAALLPALQVGSGYSRTDGQVQGSFGDVRQVEFETYEGNLGLVYRLNIGSQINQSLAARREVDAAVYEALSTRQRLLLRVTELYHDLVLSRVGMSVAGELLDSSRELRSIADARSKAGVGSGADVSRSEARIADAERQHVASRNLWHQSSIRLAVALRMDPAVTIEPVESRLEPWQIVPSEGGDWSSRAAGQRPDVQAADSRSAAAEQRIEAAQWDLWGPELVARVEELLVGDSLPDVEDRSRHGLWLGWTLSLEKARRIDQARAERLVARLRAAKLKEQAIGEVSQSGAEIRAAGEQIPLANKELEAARTTLRLNTARYKSGTALAVEIIDAQDAVTRATLNLAQAIGAYNVAQARLLAATGALDRKQLPAHDPR
jgi:outer membrane protein TolC